MKLNTEGLLGLALLVKCSHAWVTLNAPHCRSRLGIQTPVLFAAPADDVPSETDKDSDKADSTTDKDNNDDEIVDIDTEESLVKEKGKKANGFTLDDGAKIAKDIFETAKEAVTKEDVQNFLFLQSLAAITSRGEQATDEQLASVRSVVEELEASNPTSDPVTASELLQGTWELTFTDTKQLFRSSPFFMAGRAVCQNTDQVKQYNWFCTMHRKALAISNIGPVRQIITPTQLISEFSVQAGAVPFLNDFTPFSYSGGLPITIDGAIVSTADWTPLDGERFELLMDTVEIKGSNLPGLRQLLDGGLKLGSRDLGKFLESNVGGYSNPRPIVKTTYLNEQFRISRDMDNNIFVYVKTSPSTTPTNYDNIDSDLGVAKLLEGFNDAVTKFYL